MRSSDPVNCAGRVNVAAVDPEEWWKSRAQTECLINKTQEKSGETNETTVQQIYPSMHMHCIKYLKASLHPKIKTREGERKVVRWKRSCYRGNLQQPVWEDVTPAGRPTAHLPVHPSSNSWETLTQETERSQENSQTANARSRPHLPEISEHDTKILCTHSHNVFCLLIPMILGSSAVSFSSDHSYWIFIRESAPDKCSCKWISIYNSDQRQKTRLLLGDI